MAAAVVEDVWVQCDDPKCKKWRKLPSGSQAPPDDVKWCALHLLCSSANAYKADNDMCNLPTSSPCRYCRMNPDPLRNSCAIEEEVRHPPLIALAAHWGVNPTLTVYQYISIV